MTLEAAVAALDGRLGAGARVLALSLPPALEAALRAAGCALVAGREGGGGEPVDAVVVPGVVPELERVLDEVRTSLAPDGRVLVLLEAPPGAEPDAAHARIE